MLAKRREAARQAAKERKSALILQQKRIEQAKDEVYDQLVKGGGSTTKSSDKMRKLKKGEHYEDAQREFLENEIRIRYGIRWSYKIELNVSIVINNIPDIIYNILTTLNLCKYKSI